MMSKYNFFPQNEIPQDKMSPKERFWRACFLALFIIHFVVFMLPESTLSNFHADIFCAKIYPKALLGIIEKNIINPTIFPASAYVFWAIFPFVAISFFVYPTVSLWPSWKLEMFISRRKDEKTIYVCSMFCFVVSVGSLFISNPSSPMALFLKPFQNKFSFFILYESITLMFPMSIVLLVANIRARIHLNRK
ncbi:MAG: hypothetical protein LBG78_03020 [Azoarcus sp.]|jgi:hypothetical protein|nr:hypothetical protein [Azoarcus sp.]